MAKTKKDTAEIKENSVASTISSTETLYPQNEISEIIYSSLELAKTAIQNLPSELILSGNKEIDDLITNFFFRNDDNTLNIDDFDDIVLDYIYEKFSVCEICWKEENGYTLPKMAASGQIKDFKLNEKMEFERRNKEKINPFNTYITTNKINTNRQIFSIKEIIETELKIITRAKNTIYKMTPKYLNQSKIIGLDPQTGDVKKTCEEISKKAAMLSDNDSLTLTGLSRFISIKPESMTEILNCAETFENKITRIIAGHPEALTAEKSGNNTKLISIQEFITNTAKKRAKKLEATKNRLIRNIILVNELKTDKFPQFRYKRG